MRAIVKRRPGVGVELVDVAPPRIGPTDVLIRVRAASICGSDIPIVDWNDPWVVATVKPNQIVGHEFCGHVADVGEWVENVKVGDFVTAEGHLNCGVCPRCLCGEAHICPHTRLVGFDYPGAFCDYVAVRESNVIKLGKLSLEIGAIQDPFGNAVHAASRVSLANASVLVTGCGPIGLMTIAVARSLGSRQIVATEVSGYRRELARTMGATTVLNPRHDDVEGTIQALTGDELGVDVLFEMSGNEDALIQGLKSLRNGGSAILLGLGKQPTLLDFANLVVGKGINMHGVVGRVMFRTWHQARMLLTTASNAPVDLSPIITHRLRLDEFEEGFDLMRAGQCGKVLLFPDDETLNESLETGEATL